MNFFNRWKNFINVSKRQVLKYVNKLNLCNKWTVFINIKEVQVSMLVNKLNFCNRWTILMNIRKVHNFFLLLHILIFAKTMLIIEPKTTSDVSLIMIYKITNFYITKEIEFLWKKEDSWCSFGFGYVDNIPWFFFLTTTPTFLKIVLPTMTISNKYSHINLEIYSGGQLWPSYRVKNLAAHLW